MWQTFEWRLIFKQRSFTEFLLLTATFTISIWLIQFVWKRRKLYESSFILPGPYSLPFVGSALNFIGTKHDIFTYISYLFTIYPEKFAIWFGTRLFYAVSDPKYFEILLTSPHALKKENLYRFAEPISGQGLFSAASVEHWKKHRKIINRTFKQKILDRFLDVFVQQSGVIASILEQHAGKGEVDLFKLLSRFTLDTICETAMGVEIKAQTTNSSFSKLVDRVMEIIFIRIFNVFYHIDIVFNNSPLGREFYSDVDKLRSFTKKVITERKKRYADEITNNGKLTTEEGTTGTAFLDFLIEINNQGDFHFSDEELIDETITFMIAGSDTTANTNCFVLMMLALHQEIQEKVLAEILEVVGPNGNVELTHLPQLKYLERVIKETLRMFPIAPILVRCVDADLDLGDFVVQNGCSVVVGILWAHRNEKYWPNPSKFDPDRFLPEEVAKRPPAAFIPFSYGPRNCIGMKYGMMAMKTFLATVIRKYHVNTAYKSIEEIELTSNLVLRPKNGFKVSFELRNCY